MAALTGEEVIYGIALKVRGTLDSSELHSIYVETPRQNARKPYAFLHLLNGEQTNELRPYSRQDSLVDVRIHPEDNQLDVNTWARQIVSKLSEGLQHINIDDKPVKCRTMSWNVTDGVLHFIVGYGFRVINCPSEETEPHIMNILSYDQNIK